MKTDTSGYIAPQLVARMRKASNKLRTILGRVVRDIERKAQHNNTHINGQDDRTAQDSQCAIAHSGLCLQ